MDFSKLLRNLLSIIGLFSFLCLPTFVLAETVSIITNGDKSEDFRVEAALKRHLRAEGYTVKGGTTDGYLLLVSVLPNITVGGFKSGVTGHLTVSSLSWQAIGDTMVSDTCKGENEVAKKINALVGTRMIYINAYMATAADEEQIAEMMSTYANRLIRATSQKITAFIEDAGKSYEREVSSPPLDQIR